MIKYEWTLYSNQQMFYFKPTVAYTIPLKSRYEHQYTVSGRHILTTPLYTHALRNNVISRLGELVGLRHNTRNKVTIKTKQVP